MASVPSVVVFVEHRVVPGEVLAGTEIPGLRLLGGGGGGTWGRGETKPNATLSPP